MKLIIDVPKEEYIKISNSNPSYADDFNLYYAIKNGTPLPEHHGVLKDATNLMRGLYTDMQTIEETFMSSDVYKMIDEECPTIIEADKEVKADDRN